jgi:hypothetical protein
MRFSAWSVPRGREGGWPLSLRTSPPWRCRRTALSGSGFGHDSLTPPLPAAGTPGYGARLPSDLKAAGLVEVHANHIQRCHAGGALPAQLLSLTIERLRQRLVLLGADNEEIDEARRLLDSSASRVTSPTTCVAQGRRSEPS